MGTTIISAKLAKRIIAKISELVGSSIEEKVKGHIETKRTELFIRTLYLIFDYPYKYYTFKHFEV